MPETYQLQPLATLQDLDDSGFPPKTWGNQLGQTQVQRLLLKASAYVLGYIGDKIQLPLVPPYDLALNQCTCQITAWWIITRRGFNPDDPGDKVARTCYEDAMRWLKEVANGKIRLNQAGSNPESLQPSVDTNLQRGYGSDYLGTNPPFIRGPSNWGG